MNHLTPEQKQLIELLTAYGLTTSKIATTLGLTHEYVQEYLSYLNNSTTTTNESSHIGAVENDAIVDNTTEEILLTDAAAEIIETIADNVIDAGTDVTPEITPEPAYAGMEGGETGGAGAGGDF